MTKRGRLFPALLCTLVCAASFTLRVSALGQGSGESSPGRERIEGAGAGANNRGQLLPEGPGQSLVAAKCVGCHTLDVALSQRAKSDDWLVTIQRMIDLGAPITDEDAAAMATYLGQRYGPASATTQAAGSVLPDGPGRDVLMRKCFQCHQMSMWSALRQDRQAWEGVLYRMVGRGALWTEDEIDTMADYLTQARGPVAAGRD